MNYIQRKLFSLQDPSYRAFQCKLMPTVDPNIVIGVRMPQLRKMAKELTEGERDRFLSELPHETYEENNLHGIIISSFRDVELTIVRLDAFLPFVDNWATCDLIRPVCFRHHPDSLLPAIRRWMCSSHPYTVRFGIEMLMTYFLDDTFQSEYLKWVADVESDHYYIRMMVAWYFAEALVKQYEEAILYLSEHRLSPWIHQMTIRKAIESFRIPDDRKLYLKTLRKYFE